MEVSTLQLAPSKRAKLVSGGYTSLSALSSLSPPDMVKPLKVSHEEAVKILKIALQSKTDLSNAIVIGDSWSHAFTNQVILYWNGNERYAYIDKSPSLQPGSAPYSVTIEGMRDTSLQYKRTRIT